MTDLVVAGGGPAGLAVAIEARQRGLSVTVVDRAVPPVDKACGEGLMPNGVKRLVELGVRIPPEHRATLGGIRYFDGGVQAEARFPGHTGLGIRRTVLHDAMIRRAEELGARLIWKTEVRGLAPTGVVTANGEIQATWTIAADGLHSRLRADAGLGRSPGRRRRYGLTRHFAIPPWTDCVEVYWGDRGEAYVTPVGPGEVGVALLWSGMAASFDARLDGFPQLRQRLHGAVASSRDRGAGPFEQRVRSVISGRLALVGDASGYLDAIVGDGLSSGLDQAAIVVDAISLARLSAYAPAHRRLIARSRAAARVLLSVGRHPRFRRRVIAALASEPDRFSRLLAILARQAPTWSTVLSVAPRLAWRVAWPAPRPAGRGR